MIRTELPIPRAFRALLEAVRIAGLSQSDALTFALSWLAAARAWCPGNVPGAASVDDLGTPEGWKAVADASCRCTQSFAGCRLTAKRCMGLLPAGKNAIKELVSDLGTQPWDVLPALTASAIASRDAEGMVSAEVAELMLDMLEPPAQDLWVPFDRWGTLTVRALRRGWRVKSAPASAGANGLGSPAPVGYRVRQPRTHMLETEVERDRSAALTRAACVLACPPFGMSVTIPGWPNGIPATKRL